MDDGRFKTLVSVNGSISSKDLYLSVRVENVEKAIEEIHKLGYAVEVMKLA